MRGKEAGHTPVQSDLKKKDFMNLFEMKQERAEALNAAESILDAARAEKREMNASEVKLVDAHLDRAKELSPKIEQRESANTITKNLGAFPGLTDAGRANPDHRVIIHEEGAFKASQWRTQFGEWMGRGLSAIGGGLTPQMEAAAPSGPVSIGTTGGWDSVGITVPTEILPFLPAYYALDSFGNAGATQIFTDHTRPLVKPIISAGAADSTFLENAAPSTSQPFGLSSFTFGGTKYARLVLASYESLMNSELPLQGVILDELLASIASTLTTAVTTSMYAALTTPVGSTIPLGVGGTTSIYTNMVDLRHAVPPRFDRPDNRWMLSRVTLAAIKNCRASTSGVPMFDPNSNLIFGREFVVNDNFDAICGAGFVAYGDWADGCFIRKTPLFTRVFMELYAQSGQIGYRTQQWCDQHFLAELVAATQAPSFQPLYYTSLASAS